MQSNLITVQLASWPKIVCLTKHQNSISFFVKLPNRKQGKPYYYMKALATGQTGKDIYDLYRKGDYIIVEVYMTSIQSKSISELLVIREYPIF
uniref:Single-stranded DNA binding protein n=1 Tax=Yamadaella caenomyce TaxID=259029 RepID=A0A1G4NYR6_9FLOR|nr:Hypothetical protein ycf41 [Yamadaella caenomyce]SCW23785.1 Hypothetical protein ycf41 [Yamadaella caenomyce]